MSLPSKGKILALDLGSRRTGVALSDKAQKIAFLREEIVHKTNEELTRSIAQLIEFEKVVGILVGLPLYLSGKPSPQTEKVLRQIEDLKKLNLPLATIDERLSSKQAFTPGIKVLDSRVAQILLENFLNSLR